MSQPLASHYAGEESSKKIKSTYVMDPGCTLLQCLQQLVGGINLNSFSLTQGTEMGKKSHELHGN